MSALVNAVSYFPAQQMGIYDPCLSCRGKMKDTVLGCVMSQKLFWQLTFHSSLSQN